MKIQKMYVKSIKPYPNGTWIEVESWVCPETLLKQLHYDNSHLEIEKCCVKTSIHMDEENKDNPPTPKVLLFVPCFPIEFI